MNILIDRLMFLCFGIILGMISEYVFPSKRFKKKKTSSPPPTPEAQGEVA